MVEQVDRLGQIVRDAIVGCHDDRNSWGKIRITDLMELEEYLQKSIAAEARGMEAAAVIADNRAKASETAIKHLPDEDKSYLRGSLIASEQIAAKIRAAIERGNGQHRKEKQTDDIG